MNSFKSVALWPNDASRFNAELTAHGQITEYLQLDLRTRRFLPNAVVEHAPWPLAQGSQLVG